jgi:hypothetical protein
MDTNRTSSISRALASSLIATLLYVAIAALPSHAQSGGQQRLPKAAAPIDLTGYWVSMVTEDWKYRMVTPPKGEYGGLPLKPEGRKFADAWDPAKDEKVGEQCKAFGAAALMRIPGRLNIHWEDDSTLRVDTDAGTQTRLFRFAPPPAQTSVRSWQGYSTAVWQPQGNLKVVTANMRAGYLRKNGVPYSENAVLTEYYERLSAPDGDEWLIVTTIVDDPTYLNTPYVTSSHFKKQVNNAGWNPTPCSSR